MDLIQVIISKNLEKGKLNKMLRHPECWLGQDTFTLKYDIILPVSKRENTIGNDAQRIAANTKTFQQILASNSFCKTK